AGAGLATLGLQFDNAGAVEVQSGDLTLGVFGGGGASFASSTGSFSAPGGTLEVRGFHDLAASSSGDASRAVFATLGSSVAGRYHAHAATVVVGGGGATTTFSGAVDGVGALTVTGATADFSPAAGGPVTLTLTSLEVDGNGILQGSDSFV